MLRVQQKRDRALVRNNTRRVFDRVGDRVDERE